MDVVRRFDDDRFYKRAVIALVGALLVAVVGFAAYYYWDRHPGGNTPLVDRELAQVQQLVKNDPSNPANRVALANVYLRKGDYKNAVAQYNEALKADDKNLNALTGLGLAYYRDGKTKEAVAALEQVRDANKDDPVAQRSPVMSTVHYLLGTIYQSQGNLQGAEGELKMALQGNPTDADTLYAAAQVESQLGNSQLAIDLYRSALQFVPDFQEAYAGLAKTYAAAGMATEANYANAMVDFCKGSYDTAISQLEGVVKAKPDFAEAYYGLGASYDKKGIKDKAIADYQKAIELQPDFAAAQSALGRLGGQLPANAKPVPGH